MVRARALPAPPRASTSATGAAGAADPFSIRIIRSTEAGGRVAEVSELCTTVLVVALLRPSDVGTQSYPSKTAIQTTTKPNTALLITPLPRS